MVFVALAGDAIAAVNKLVQLVLSFDPCTIKLLAVVAKICDALVFKIYQASNFTGETKFAVNIAFPI